MNAQISGPCQEMHVKKKLEATITLLDKSKNVREK
jgi:hypothetical protein